jgi:hypothetical protein
MFFVLVLCGCGVVLVFILYLDLPLFVPLCLSASMATAAHSKDSSTVAKTFAEALSNSCNISTSQLSKSCLKGEQVYQNYRG